MIAIRITMTDGTKHFVSEQDHWEKAGIILKENILSAFQYKSIMEFMVTWKYWPIQGCIYEKRDVLLFESIDITTSRSRIFLIEKNINLEQPIDVNDKSFLALMNCSISDSCFCYDKNDKWIARPSNQDFDIIKKIRYYNRGLLWTISSYRNWLQRRDSRSWHHSFQQHHALMMEPFYQQIYLSEFDKMHELVFTRMPKRGNK